MIVAIIFGALTSLLVQGTVSYEDCKAKNFEPKACAVSKKMDKLGK
jgi:hypothetical protein